MRHLMLMGILCAAPAAALDRDYAQLAARRDIERSEKISLPATVLSPRYLILSESPWHIAVSAAIGTDGMHGIRHTWFYELTDKKTTRLYKLPFDALEVVESSGTASTVRGEYWLYDCFLCDGPEAGYMMKLPVMVERRAGRYYLRLAVEDAQRASLRQEADRYLQNTSAKYGKNHREIERMKRQLDALFGNGLSS